ncbi:hypothetical protein AB205_0040260 [Aquarana catesbeiana]|uniref:Mitochondrial uncoupling protein 4 n=1 Tax=Aquarana catesbeiana TaxID=8400 RepID=A0A2G9SCM0_AQUCT|nr:hypothetical protein AB205_0040260 [Aquarana catesbeiana]
MAARERAPSGSWPRLSKFVLSACAASVAELVTFPLDLTKTRLQIQGEAALKQHGEAGLAGPYRGMVRTAVGIVQEEGLLKLWQGATPAVYRHIVYSGVRMVAYEQIRDSPLGKGDSNVFPLWKSVVGGMMAGAIGQFFASPTDLVKVQMQMEGKRRLEGKPPRVRGVYHAFVTILSKGGIRGLWAGWVPNVQRAALVNMGDQRCEHYRSSPQCCCNRSLPSPLTLYRSVQKGERGTGYDADLTTYDTVKHYLLRNTNLKDNSICHSISSICSGLVAATLGTPADVIKTRIMNQPRDKHGRGILYKSSTDCFIQAVRGEGFLSLYKGFIPTWMRMGQHDLQRDSEATCTQLQQRLAR